MRKKPKILLIEIQLKWADIPVWRIVELPHTHTLHELHCCIQVAMGWESCHLYEFRIKDKRYGMDPMEYMLIDEDSNVLNADDVKLYDLGLAVGDTFSYTYDFGDGWEHEITVKGYTPHQTDSYSKLPICLAGAMACPPEDIGGIPVYNAIVQYRLHRNPIEFDPDLEEIFKDFDPYETRIHSRFVFPSSFRSLLRDSRS